ncbi:mannose 6-phosphate receptor domain-containing protein [Phlegmacium glaucopus]|nr:mannose 6-phosphate receptor domain-containing protein [Phlegmacium glaucopus]
MFIRNLRRGWLATLFVLSALTHSALSIDEPCTIRDNGKYYDLNQLKSSKDVQISTDTGLSIYFNVCQNVKTEMFGLKDDIQESDVGGFIRRAHGDFAFGMVNATLTVRDSRPRFVLSGGSYCKVKGDDIPGDMRGSALVEFTCDKTIFGLGQPRLVAQLPPGDDEEACAWVIEWRTHFACPISEGRSVWGIFAILAVTFLALLMTYTVLGTLYNRYVLQLRGVDQIPQFSFESMRYHGGEALDWIKDIITGLDIGGHRSNGTPYGGLPAGRPSGGLRTSNPVSHHSQTSGSGPPGDFEENGGLDNGNTSGGGFIRPQQSKNRPPPFQRLETNPVSHQSQVIAQSLSFSAAASPPPSQSQHHTDDLPQGRRLATDRRGSTKEERDFMLGDDEDAEELTDVSTPVPRTPTPRISPPSAAPSSSADVAAAVREGDLGGGEHVRL